MSALLLKTLSQALQAFLPVAVTLAWLYRREARGAAKAVLAGLILAILFTPFAGSQFQQVSRQAQLEASLAWLTTAIALVALATLVAARRTPGRPAVAASLPLLWRLALVAATMLVVLRQTMEIAVVLRVALFDLRSLDATQAIGIGLLLGIVVAGLIGWAGRIVFAPAVEPATVVFGVLFVAQAALYAFHESAESGWLPWSAVLHAATEPYGPDGLYGPPGSCLVAGIPVLVGLAVTARARWLSPGRKPLVAVVATALVVIGMAALLTRSRSPERTSTPALAGVGPAVAVPGRVLFRRTNIEQDYGLLTSAALDPAGDEVVAAALACERVSFGGGRGICLQADRGLFTTYRAVLFDDTLTAGRALPLEGSPSRTRVSSDGRVGAITVFPTSIHNYASTTFSTTTTLLDMATGDSLGNLETFQTWRDGVRMEAADFNFWGVTFAHDPNTFYATLRTAGQTYLVRGELGLRKLTVLRENVECPSLSPDNRRLAFKKRIGQASVLWRLYVLDLESMAEHAISAETRSIDDQIEWLDDQRVLYGVPRASPSAVTDVWVAPVDGSTPARVFLSEAESPIVVR